MIETIKKLLDKDEMLKNTLTSPQIMTTEFKNDANLYGALYSLIQLKKRLFIYSLFLCCACFKRFCYTLLILIISI